MQGKVDFKGLDKSLRIQRIIDTAIEIFHRKGYRAATLDDVASELGVTRAALYHYVSSKENLLSTIYLQALERFFAKAYEIGESKLSPPEKLRAFVRHNVNDVIIGNLAMFGVFFSEESELPTGEAIKIREEKKKYTRVMEKILEEGMAKGVFRRTDPRLQAAAILGMCNWTYKWYKPGKSSRSPDEIAEHFIVFMESGVFAEDPDPEHHSGRAALRRSEEVKRLTAALHVEAEALSRRIKELEEVLDT